MASMRSSEDKISRLLDKTTDFDKDERYMATSDLCGELNKGVELSPSLESKVCAAVLKQLDDKSNDVQSIAVKCLGILVGKVQETQVDDICTRLSDLLLNGKTELRDIYAIGLKTTLSDVSQASGASIAPRLCPKLLAGLEQNQPTPVKAETLDILTDLLRRFGLGIPTVHEDIMSLLLPQLEDSSALVRKRATACLGSLGVMASDALLTKLVTNLLTSIQNASDPNDARTLIQTIGTLSRTAGHRLGGHLDAILPLLIRFCGNPEDESMQNETSNDLRENCFHALESFVLRCPSEMTVHVEQVLQLANVFVTYDPNYSYEESEEEDEPMEEDEEEEFSDDEDDGDYSDDDDTSWKVRRASLRVLSALITTRGELLEYLYANCSQLLISRFKEREENVRVDVFSVFTELLRATHQARPSHSVGQEQMNGTPAFVLLRERTHAIVTSANKQFGTKASIASRCAVLKLLSELVQVERDQLANYITLILPNVLHAADDKHSDLKLDALTFLRLLLDTHERECFRASMDQIADVAVRAAKGDWYRTVAKALALIEAIARDIRRENDFVMDASKSQLLFDAVWPTFQAKDMDSDVKDGALSSMGQILAQLGDQLDSAPTQVYPVLLERMRNDVTRVAAMKALAEIARSPLRPDLSSVLADALPALSDLLRQQSRTLKQVVLETLQDLIQYQSQNVDLHLLKPVLSESGALLVESDLQLCRLALELALKVLISNAKIVQEAEVREYLVKKTVGLARSPMVKGMTLTALQQLLSQLTLMNVSGADFDTLVNLLLENADACNRDAMANAARCVAAVCKAAGDEQKQAAFNKFMTDVASDQVPEKHRMLSLFAVGEYGRVLDVPQHAQVKDALVQCFASPSEDVKSAAAHALGGVCVGNMGAFLDTILENLEQGQDAYLLLAALREVISEHASVSQPEFDAQLSRVVSVLEKLSDAEAEGVRTIVAECLGKLLVADEAHLLPVVSTLCAADSAASRWTTATTLKYALTSASARKSSMSLLFASIEPFLKTLDDDDLNVRRAALLALNTAAHHQSAQLLPHLVDVIIPSVVRASEVKMVRTVDLGPFKHKVDDGLPLRKAAYACVDTLLEAQPSHFDVQVYLPTIEAGLKDQDDVQMLCHQVLVKLCQLKPGAVVGTLDAVVDPLDKTVMKKVKDDQVGTEVERAKDLIRSGLRAVEAIGQVEEAKMHPKFQSLYTKVKNTKSLESMLATLEAER